MPEENVNNNSESAADRTQAAPVTEPDNGGDGAHKVDAAGHLRERIALLQQDLTAKEQELARQKALVQEHETQRVSLNAEREAAVAAYRGLVLKSNPLVPVELIAGGTVEEIDESLRKAADLVGHIRQGLEAQHKTEEQADAIPAGAPGRTPPDLSGMTAREKINYGLNQTRQNR